MLTVSDMSADARVLSTICGATEQSGLQLEGDWLQLNFSSDSANSGRGVSVAYSFSQSTITFMT